MARNLLKTAQYFEHRLKLAAYPTLDRIGPLVKNVIENLKSIHPDIMQGVLFASNVQAQTTIEDMYVSFLLNVNEDPKFQDILANNKDKREELIQSAVKQTLELNFKEFRFRTHYSEFPIKKPGFFAQRPA
jgi:hypothetical protein